MAQLQAHCEASGAGPFSSLAGPEREELVSRLRAGAVQELDGGGRPLFEHAKQLTLLGYYSSEIGGSVELRFNPIPGDSPGCVPLESIGRAWYKHWGIA